MQARTAFRGAGISKRMAAVVVAVLLALVLVAAGGFLAKATNRPIAPATHFVAGQSGSTWTYGNGRSGTSWIEEPETASASLIGSFHEPGTRRGGNQIAP